MTGREGCPDDDDEVVAGSSLNVRPSEALELHMLLKLSELEIGFARYP